MAISEHNEIEAKLAADKVSVRQFCDYAWKAHAHKYEMVTGPDTYYEHGDAVVRHREKLNSKSHELTVKRRKSTRSTRDREEIDLHFALKSGVEDVRAFLAATGFEKAFKLVKTAHIFWIMEGDLELTVVIYDVWRDNDGKISDEKRFIEVEAEKGSSCSVEEAKKVVNSWVRSLRSEFELDAPLNDSLYEIYSGKKYSTV